MNFKQKQSYTVERLSAVAKLSEDQQFKYLDKIDVADMDAIGTLILKDNIESIQECEFKNIVKRGVEAKIEWLKKESGWIETLLKHKLSRTILFVKYTIKLSNSFFLGKKTESLKSDHFEDEQMKRLKPNQQQYTNKLD